MASRGRVVLVGAGPGDPDLITVRGAKALSRADVVLYDQLATGDLLDLAPARAERINVGKRGHEEPTRTQEEINALIVEHALAGRVVVRLKGGDPFVFGRGGEEVSACAEAGIPFEIVPGDMPRPLLSSRGTRIQVDPRSRRDGGNSGRLWIR